MINLARNTNQAKALGEFAIQFLKETSPSEEVLERLKLFHTDSVMCGLSALALNTNAPTVLRNEAMQYPKNPGARCFGSEVNIAPEKAALANCAAVREWDANGTVFGYSEGGGKAGEYGHNDYYGVAVAAAQAKKLNGEQTLKGMLLLDEIRGRLCEYFSLREHKIDHVLHGGIASAAAYGALVGASPEQIEHAIGMLVAHCVPFRAIRHGKELSDSKGSSAAFIAEQAILSVHRALRGFIGPKDIFRNPQSVFGVFGGCTESSSPFDLNLGIKGSDFSIMNMHFKLGLYEHQSAGAISSLLKLISQNPHILTGEIVSINIYSYKDALRIIGDPSKYSPSNRQSADHSMPFIIATLMSKAFQNPELVKHLDFDSFWKELMLNPFDYTQEAISDKTTSEFMRLIKFSYGGPEFDERYPEGIPTQVEIQLKDSKYTSEIEMFPPGHSKNFNSNILDFKFHNLGNIALEDPRNCIEKLQNLDKLSKEQMESVYFWKYKRHNYKV